jgi:hypothetical protein
LLILVSFILGCTLVVPLWVLGHTQNLRTAFHAWWSFAKYLLALAVPAIIIGLSQWATLL